MAGLLWQVAKRNRKKFVELLQKSREVTAKTSYEKAAKLLGSSPAWEAMDDATRRQCFEIFVDQLKIQAGTKEDEEDEDAKKKKKEGKTTKKRKQEEEEAEEPPKKTKKKKEEPSKDEEEATKKKARKKWAGLTQSCLHLAHPDASLIWTQVLNDTEGHIVIVVVYHRFFTRAP